MRGQIQKKQTISAQQNRGAIGDLTMAGAITRTKMTTTKDAIIEAEFSAVPEQVQAPTQAPQEPKAQELVGEAATEPSANAPIVPIIEQAPSNPDTALAAQPKPSSIDFGERGLQIKSFDDAWRVATAFAKSGLFGATTATQAFVKLQLGAELGLPPASAMQAIHVIDGKPSMSAALVAARIKMSGRYRFVVEKWTALGCKLNFLEKVDGQWVPCGDVTFTVEDAKVAGLMNKANWKYHPRAMCFARCITQGARSFCSDVFYGAPVYDPDELN